MCVEMEQHVVGMREVESSASVRERSLEPLTMAYKSRAHNSKSLEIRTLTPEPRTLKPEQVQHQVFILNKGARQAPKPGLPNNPKP